MNFRHLIPLLDVTSLADSIAFYRDALGFTIEDELTWNGKTEWVLLSTGNIKLMLAESGRYMKTASASAGMFFFYLDETRELYTTLRSKGHTISNIQYQGPDVREFCIQDPDGYILWFSPKKLQEPDQVVMA